MLNSHSLRSLKNPQYRIYFFTQLLSQIGCWMHSVAQNWLIFRLTGSTTFLGIMNCAEHLPIFFLNPISGILCDRVSLVKIARTTQLLLASQAFVLAYVSQSASLTSETKGVLFVLALFSGFAYAFDIPARQTLLGFLVSKEEIPNAIALNSSMYNLARIVGPSIAGLSIAAWGESICFFINGLTFIPAFFGFSFMSYKHTLVFQNQIDGESTDSYKNKWFDLFHEGIVFIRKEDDLLKTLLLSYAFCFLGFSYVVLMPALVTQTFHGDSRSVGWLMGVTGIGAVMGSLTLANKKDSPINSQYIAISAIVFASCITVLGMMKSIILASITLLLLGYFMVRVMSSTNTMIQLRVPMHLRGRVLNLYTLGYTGFSPMGALVAGQLANKIGASHTIFLAGLFCLGSALLYFGVMHQNTLNSSEEVQI